MARVAETFTGSNADLGAATIDHDWTDVGGVNPQVVSNRLVLINDGGGAQMSRCGTAYSGADHEVGMSCTDFTAQSGQYTIPGVVARFQPANASGYVFYLGRISDNSYVTTLMKVEDLWETELASTVWSAPTPPFAMAIQVEGTAIRGYVNGVLVVSTTDASFATGSRGGVWAYSSHGGNLIRCDNWYIDAIGWDAVPEVPYVNPAFSAADSLADAGVAKAGGYVWNGTSWDKPRMPVIFKNLSALAITNEATIWTPASGKKFRLLGAVLTQGVATGAVTLRDHTAGSTILTLPAQTIAVARQYDLGDLGILSGAANNLLTAQGVTNETLTGYVYGTEE